MLKYKVSTDKSSSVSIKDFTKYLDLSTWIQQSEWLATAKGLDN